MTYSGTNLPLTPDYPVDQLRSTLLAGPGATGLYSGAVSFLRMSRTLTTAAGDLDAVLSGLSEGLDGPAAAAARQHITSLVENGRVGAAQATLAYNGLNDQGDHHVRARQDMQAVPAQPDPGRQQVFAVDSAARYQDNANHTLTAVFQPFVAPPASPVNVAPAAAPHAAGWGNPPGTGAAHPGAGGGPPVAATPAGPGVTGLQPPGAVPGGPGAPDVRPPLQRGPSTTPTRLPNPGGGPPVGTTPGGSPRGTAPGADRAPTAVSPQRVPPGGAPGDPHLPGGPRPGGPADQRTSPPRSGLPGTAEPWTPTGPPSQSWRNSQAWDTGRSGDPHPAEPGSGRSVSSRPAAPGAPGTAAPASNGRPGPSGTGQGMAPMMGGGGTRGQDDEHRRPPWLLLDDPQAFWLSGLPPHTPAVIEAPTEDEPGPGGHSATSR